MGFVKLSLLPVVLGLGMTSLVRAQVPPDRPKVVIDDVDLQGAIHLPESVREQLVASLMHREYEEKSDWISDVDNRVVRAETDGWPERENEGYLGFSVQARWNTLLKEPGLLHVQVVITLDEGQQKWLGAACFGHPVSHPTLGPLGQPEKAMGHESRIEPWSPNLTVFSFAGFGTD